MAKVCVQCDKKIGFFKTPIDGIYCSYDCRDAARRDIKENQKRAAERQVAAERAAAEAEEAAAVESRRSQAEIVLKNTCPKCGVGWGYDAGAGAGGLDHGHCTKCGFSADFSAIEKCPTCTQMSLVVEAESARCPRCKFRRH
jgi:hypothetical protein